MIKSSPTHDEDLAEVQAFVRSKHPTIDPDSPLWWPWARCMAIADPGFPRHCQYLFDELLTSHQMKERADYLDNLTKFTHRNDPGFEETYG